MVALSEPYSGRRVTPGVPCGFPDPFPTGPACGVFALYVFRRRTKAGEFTGTVCAAHARELRDRWGSDGTLLFIYLFQSLPVRRPGPRRRRR